MPREPVTIRLEEEFLDELDAEADAEGRSRSEYIRQLLRNRHDETEAELKARVSKLESAVFGPNTEGGDDVSGPNTDADERAVVGANKEVESAVSGPTTAGEVAATLEIPGSGAEEKRARRAWLAECLAWMQRQDSVRKADVVAWWDHDEAINYQTGDGLWESLVKPALDELAERGVVEKPNTTNYRWVG